jgi:tetratricopeptide (TPR) repeat protein
VRTSPLLLAGLVVLLVPLAAARPARAEDPPESPPGLPALLAEADAAYARRDEPGALEEVRARLAAAEARAPGAYEVLWRLARLAFWEADDPGLSDRAKSQLGKRAWELGDRATRADPSRVEGWNFAAAGVGLYALGIGVFRALREGIEGKFKERLSRAEAIAPDYSAGAIQTAWGRFWFKLPWPKYDAGKARRALEAALTKNPDNVRAHLYLAELWIKEGQRERARDALAKALAHPPGRYDPPEERRAQALARAALAALGAERPRPDRPPTAR